MSNSGVKPFENNWAYLKTELRWLDRVLLLAVSRKRQDDKSLNKVASTPVDKVTSHWWKGIVAINRGIDDREGPPPKPAPKNQISMTYSQFLEHQIQASYQAGVALGIPLLRDRFALTEVEKNILLMAIAPEINRRYGRLYDYLQDDAGAMADLPTVDLCLRLLCRHDDDWQRARARLTAVDSLVNRGLVEWIGDEEGTLLSQQVRIVDEVANYCLADHPDIGALEAYLTEATKGDSPPAEDESFAVAAPAVELVAGVADDAVPVVECAAPPPTSAAPTATHQPYSSLFLTQRDDISWDSLVLPKTLLRQLQYLCRQAEQRPQHPNGEGLIVLLAGDAGTGKTIAAAAIAAHLNLSLSCIELHTLVPEGYPPELTGTPGEDAGLLLVKHGEEWFSRRSQVEDTWLHQWWQWRQQFSLTLVSVHRPDCLRPSWHRQFDAILTFPRPDVKARRRLWEQAFAPEFPTAKIDWSAIAHQWKLTGGEIAAIARTVEFDLRSRGRSTVTLPALQDALLLRFPGQEVV